MSPTPVPSQAEMQKLLDKIDSDAFKLVDAIQNAQSVLEDKPSLAEIAKAQEYLHEWSPAWSQESGLITTEVAQRLGTDRLRAYIATLEKEHRAMRAGLVEVADIKQSKRAVMPQQILQDDGDHCVQIAKNVLSSLTIR